MLFSYLKSARYSKSNVKSVSFAKNNKPFNGGFALSGNDINIESVDFNGDDNLAKKSLIKSILEVFSNNEVFIHNKDLMIDMLTESNVDTYSRFISIALEGRKYGITFSADSNNLIELGLDLYDLKFPKKHVVLICRNIKNN